MHDERHISLALWGKHPCRRKAWVIDQKGIGIAFPSNGVRRIGNNEIKGLVIPMMWIGQRIITSDIEFIWSNVVKKDINTT